MINILLGLILITYSFLLGFLTSQDKKEGFIKSIIILIFVETLLSIVFAFLHIFTYFAFIITHILINIAVLSFFIYKKKLHLRNFLFFGYLKKIDYYLIILIIIVLFQFWSVHYNYEGKISTEVKDFIDAENYHYKYPYYSDEWYSVAFSKFMIQNNELPVKNPIVKNNPPFLNFQLPFHSFNAALMQLFNLDPVRGYVPLTIVMNTLLIIISYLYLRIKKLSKITSFLIAILVTHITNGANLPGLWYYLPFNLGIILFISLLFFISANNLSFILLSAFLSLIFYPPLAVLVVPILFIYLFQSKKFFSKKILYLLLLFGFAFMFLFLIAYIKINNIENLFFYLIHNKLYYPGFQGDFITKLNPINIISLIALFLFVFSIKDLLKKDKYILISIFIGSFLWILYFFMTSRIIIEHERIVLLTAILVTLASVYGLQNILMWIKNRNKIIFNLLLLGLIVYILSYSLNYTSLNKWDKLQAYNKFDHSQIFNPKAPANGYLQEDEVSFFSDIKDKTILSTPWKSTTISVATGNYAFVSKEGTISVGSFEKLNNFLSSDCNGMKDIIYSKKNKKLRVGYIYLPLILNCEFLDNVYTSKEGFVLYEVNI